MRRFRISGALVTTTAMALAVIGPLAAPAHASVTARDDDGGRENSAYVDDGSDQAVKRLILPTGALTGATGATLRVYAEADACGPAGPSHRLVVNDIAVTDFNPCDEWAANAYSWASFAVPLSRLTAGAVNRFQILEFGGLLGEGDPASRNAYYGVDTNTDFGRSDVWQADDYYTGIGTDLPGELMWYLDVTDGNPPSSDTTRPACTVWPSSLFGVQGVTWGGASGRCTDDLSGVDVVTVTFTFTSIGQSEPGMTTSMHCNATRTSCDWTAYPVDPGRYDVSATATDRAGNSSSPATTTTVFLLGACVVVCITG